jgi:hypothetical protein
MSVFITRLRGLLAYEPAAVSWALNGGVALICAYAFGLTATEEAAVTTIVTALAAYTRHPGTPGRHPGRGRCPRHGADRWCRVRAAPVA